MFFVGFHCQHAFANEYSHPLSCMLLGPNPSFIIRLTSRSSPLLLENNLTPRELHAISTPSIVFTHTKSMAGDYFIAYFTSSLHSPTQMQEIQSGCYTQKTLLKVIKQIKQSAMIDKISPNFLSSIAEINHPDVPTQWNLLSPPGGIDAQNTWLDFTTGEPSATIAVLDTGILPHEALNSTILPGVHFTGNGLSGIGATPSCMQCAGYNHGTFVAGIIASTGKAAYGESIYGAAPGATILPINVFSEFTDVKTCGYPPCLLSYLSDQINALYWLAGNEFPTLPNPPISTIGINMSLGSIASCPEVTQSALNKVQRKGMSVIIAAGNQNTDAAREYPANCTGIIAVAATGPLGERASYSNWGSTVTIAAPGGNGQHGSIYSTIDNAYAYKQGTSLAAPHVAGVIALLYSIDPLLDPIKVKEIITSKDAITPFPLQENLPTYSHSCIDMEFPTKSCGVGIINAYKSAQHLRRIFKIFKPPKTMYE